MVFEPSCSIHFLMAAVSCENVRQLRYSIQMRKNICHLTTACNNPLNPIFFHKWYTMGEELSIKITTTGR